MGAGEEMRHQRILGGAAFILLWCLPRLLLRQQPFKTKGKAHVCQYIWNILIRL